MPGQYDVVGDAGDSVFAARVTITPAGPNQFVIPVSAELSPAGEDSAAIDGYACDDPGHCAIDDPTGLSFTLPHGWQAEAPFLYETPDGAVAKAPTVTFLAPDGTAALVLNPVRWSADAGTCTPSAAEDLCLVSPPTGDSLAAFSLILPSLRLAG